MSGVFGSIRKLVFGIPAGETSFERRGFRGGSPEMRARLEKVGHAFVTGYHAALEDDRLEALTRKLAGIEADFSGFAFEGAAMGLALLDYLTPWRRDRVRTLLAGAGGIHAYMVHVGVGWLLARIPGRIEGRLERLDPLLRWLSVDGYGFHEGFFHWPQYLVGGKPAPQRLTGYARRAFDQGLGRCLWFIDGGDVTRIPQTVAALPPERHGDLWSGVGLAAVYAGEVSQEALKQLRRTAGPFYPWLAQGAAFAAKARLRGGNSTAYTRLACEALCGMSAEAAAQISDATLDNLPRAGAQPAYEVWRQRVQERFRSGEA